MKATITVIEIEEKQENLSENDKERIRQAVLGSAIKNIEIPSDELARSLIKAFALLKSDVQIKRNPF
ncbi:hypothetical protein BKK50_11225 [Rodentibacter rarus]|uniref:Uncharacterized protein n=1 Tax=Rodentibacter rarus TaxID=1908260 RepID=A0A1V3IEJ7_9PAST|nr:hypothetical protein [Rodentibacter rarus]OOF38993.1 hypothetical protein BKK50_11225 [Rodentibacter rarus]